MTPDVDLAFALDLADVARAVTMSAFGPRLDVVRKQDDTVVTALDKATERAIRAVIRTTFPADGVLGEEDGLDPGTSGRVWVIDPIDGTRMFAEGIPTWTTLIGLRDDSGYLLGVADAPAIGERVTAVRGGGAWLTAAGQPPRQVHVSSVSTLADSFVVHASVEEFADRNEIAGLVNLTTRARGSRGLADAWGHLLVARGAAELLIEASDCHEWDWAATTVIVTEAGGRVTQVSGGPPTSPCRLFVSNGLVDDEVRIAFSSAH